MQSNGLQPALDKVKMDVTGTSNTNTDNADAISAAMTGISANGLFDAVEARARTELNTAKTTAAAVTAAAMTNTATIAPRVAIIDANITRMSANFSTYGPAAIESVQASTKAALDLAAGYIAFVNGELAYADTTLPSLVAANAAFTTKNATISTLVTANAASYKKQLDVFRPVVKSIYGGAITQKIAPTSAARFDSFGLVLAADGPTFMSGMTGYLRSGGVAVFNFDGISFSEDWDQIIPYPGTDTFSGFGTDVAIEGNLIDCC